MTTTRARALGSALGAAVLLLGAVGCGTAGNGADAAGQTGPAGTQGEDGPQGFDGGAGQMPGVVGKVAAVADRTAQVQGVQGQVAVTWTATTSFTRQVGAALSDVKVGDCVFVASSGEGTSASASPTAVSASSVRIIRPTNGSCTPAVRGPAGQQGPQLQGAPPSGAPQGGERRPLRGFGGVIGQVTAVTASGFTVTASSPDSDQKTSVKVTVDEATTYTTTAKGSAADVRVGVCVQAEGTADATGAVTATRVAVSQPEDGQCGGFARARTSAGTGAQAS